MGKKQSALKKEIILTSKNPRRNDRSSRVGTSGLVKQPTESTSLPALKLEMSQSQKVLVSVLPAKVLCSPSETDKPSKTETRRYTSLKARMINPSKPLIEAQDDSAVKILRNIENDTTLSVSSSAPAEAESNAPSTIPSSGSAFNISSVVEMPSRLSSRLAPAAAESPVVILPPRVNVPRSMFNDFSSSSGLLGNLEGSKTVSAVSGQSRFIESGVETLFGPPRPSSQQQNAQVRSDRTSFGSSRGTMNTRDHARSPPPGLVSNPGDPDQITYSSMKQATTRYSSYQMGMAPSLYIDEAGDPAPGFNNFSNRPNSSFPQQASLGFGRSMESPKPNHHHSFVNHLNGFESFSSDYATSNRAHHTVPYYSTPHYAQHVVYPENSYQQNPYMHMGSRYPVQTSYGNPMAYQNNHFFTNSSEAAIGLVSGCRTHQISSQGRHMVPNYHHSSGMPSASQSTNHHKSAL